jgi:hypothetical protein
MSSIDPRIAERVRGPAWTNVRKLFGELCDRVLAVAPGTHAALTTIYVKFAVSDAPTAPVYAVAWLKTAKNIVIGFALPEVLLDESLTAAPPGMTYKGITKYFRLTPGEPLPDKIDDWAGSAFRSVAKA